MKTNALRATLAATLLGLSACSHSVTTAPYKPAEQNNGMVYALPRTQLSVTVTYTLNKSVQLKNGLPVGNPVYTLTVDKPAVVTPQLIPDAGNTFIISGDGLAKDGRLDASFKFAVDDNQLLTSVSADLTDKTPQVIQSLVGSAISYAKWAAVAGTAVKTLSAEEQAAVDLQKRYTDRIAAIDRAIPGISASGDKDRMGELKQLVAERALLVEALATHRAANAPVKSEKDIAYTQVISVADLVEGEVAIKPPAAYFGLKDDNTIPKVTVALAADSTQKDNARRKLFEQITAEETEGIYYRVPSRAALTIKQGGTVLFDNTLALAELGPINKVEARYKMWAKRKTTINFSKTTGSISDYGVDTTSSAEAVTGALATSLEKAQVAATELQKQKDDAKAKEKSAEELHLAEMEQQKKLLEAELDLIKAEKALAKEKAGDAPDGGNE